MTELLADGATRARAPLLQVLRYKNMEKYGGEALPGALSARMRATCTACSLRAHEAGSYCVRSSTLPVLLRLPSAARCLGCRAKVSPTE